MEPEILSGYWKNFQFKVVEEEHFDSVVEHLQKEFFLDEPIQRYVGSTDNRLNDLSLRVRTILEMGDNISFMALDTQTGKVYFCTNDRPNL
jgi:hypothetical protein